MQVAKTILSQLGGNKFLVMTGAHSLTSGENSLTFKLPRAKIFAVKIELTAMDDYTVRLFSRKGKFDFNEEILTGVYCDQLQEIIADASGLALSL